MNNVVPSMSRAVFSGGMNAWVALHQLGREIWLCKKHPDGHWFTYRKATMQDLNTIAKAGGCDFPILLTYEQKQAHPEWPRTVPLGLVGQHERQCQLNHSQTMMELAERGGLSPEELCAVLGDLDYTDVRSMVGGPEAAIALICKRVHKWALVSAAYAEAEAGSN